MAGFLPKTPAQRNANPKNQANLKKNTLWRFP